MKSKALKDVVLTLQYCLETFEQTCQCGRCDPCTKGQEDIRRSIRTIEDLESSGSQQFQRESVVKGLQSPAYGDFVTEFHYKDGDVGAYDDVDVRGLWAHFTNKHEPSHIIIRPNSEQGQGLSNVLHSVVHNRPFSD
jgi:hypothetical protein